MRLVWHPHARADLVQVVEYIGADNPDAAYRIHAEIKTQIELLRQYPAMGRLGRIRGTRELVISETSYVAAYRVTAEAVEILRVLHGARRWPKRL